MIFLSDLLLFKQIAGEILNLPDSETVDVDPVVTQVGPGSETGRVPDCRQPGGVEVMFVGNKEMSKHFPRDPGHLIFTEHILILLSTPNIGLITR